MVLYNLIFLCLQIIFFLESLNKKKYFPNTIIYTPTVEKKIMNFVLLVTVMSETTGFKSNWFGGYNYKFKLAKTSTIFHCFVRITFGIKWIRFYLEYENNFFYFDCCFFFSTSTVYFCSINYAHFFSFH